MATLWIDSHMLVTIASGGTEHRSLMTGFTAGDTRLRRMTLVRTIIGLDVGYTVHDAGEGSQRVSLGIAVVEQGAFAAGELPDPALATDFPRLPWVWRNQYRVFGFAADQPAVFTRRIDLDIRSQRKLDNGEAYINMRNAAQEGVSAAVEVTGIIRMLWLVS